jgi:Holliday junction resolvase RusA-like endonuclease
VTRAGQAIYDKVQARKQGTLAEICAERKGVELQLQYQPGELLGTLHYPHKLPSGNAFLHRDDKWARIKNKKKLKELAGIALKPYLHLRFQGPVRIRFIVYSNRLGCDWDNQMVKYLQDCMVELGIIEKDNALCVREGGCRIERSADKVERTEIQIYRDVAP